VALLNLKKLEKLAFNNRLFVLTGRTENEAKIGLDTVGVLSVFEDIVSVETSSFDENIVRDALKEPLGRDKRNPAFIYSLINRQDLNVKGFYVYIGDTINDLLLVKNAKSSLSIKSVYFNPSSQENSDDKLIGIADYYARTSEELVTLLATLED
jgi:phosphoglycolate phosphatase-like HAD superfamily hydrolase